MAKPSIALQDVNDTDPLLASFAGLREQRETEHVMKREHGLSMDCRSALNKMRALGLERVGQNNQLPMRAELRRPWCPETRAAL